MTGRDQKIIQIVCDQLCKVEKCESCPLESFLEKEPERLHGEWIPFTTIDGYTKYATCSRCGYKRKVGIGCSLDIDNLPKFCEGCGADMRKEGGEK